MMKMSFFISFGILLHINTPENYKLPLNILHFACGRISCLFATDLKFDNVLSKLEHFMQVTRSKVLIAQY